MMCGLLWRLNFGDGGVIISWLGCTLGSGVPFSSGADWGGLIITLGGGTLLLGCVAFSKMLDNCRIACNCSSPSAAKDALVLGAVSAADRYFAACIAASAALICGNLDD
eukprot:590558-Ditylum_brightwellii.AAC.1